MNAECIAFFIFMDSNERHRRRYERRIAKRNNEKVDYESTFTFRNLWNSYHKSCRNVSWKTSVKNYKRRAFSQVSHSYIQLMNDIFKPMKTKKFTINHRGKERKVESTDIHERVIEKCFCDYGLCSIITKHLIYDNGATLKGKGYWFTIERVKKHYAKFRKKYPSGYVLTLDFHHYFESIDHDRLYGKIEKYLDSRSFSFYKKIIDNMKGLNLGSQLSQISAVFYCNELDNIASRTAFYYARYMDDTVYMFKDKSSLRMALKELRKVIDRLGLELNENKIIMWKNDFTFIKRKFIFIENKVIVSIKREYDRIVRKRIRKNGKGYDSYRVLYIKLKLFKRLSKLDIIYHIGGLHHENEIQSSH